MPRSIGSTRSAWVTNRLPLDRPADLIPTAFEAEARPVRAKTTGYVQRVDLDALMGLATDRDLLVRIDAGPGRFVTEHDTIFTVHPPGRVPDEVADRLRGTLIVGRERTPDQDLEFSIRRIVEIAQRALSPGINDPTTALYCIDRLGEALGRLAERDVPSTMRFDEARRLRILTRVTSLEALACPAFAAIARYGMADADVVALLLRSLGNLSRMAGPEASRAIADLSEQIRRESQTKAALDFDRHAIQAEWERGGGAP